MLGSPLIVAVWPVLIIISHEGISHGGGVIFVSLIWLHELCCTQYATRAAAA